MVSFPWPRSKGMLGHWVLCLKQLRDSEVWLRRTETIKMLEVFWPWRCWCFFDIFLVWSFVNLTNEFSSFAKRRALLIFLLLSSGCCSCSTALCRQDHSPAQRYDSALIATDQNFWHTATVGIIGIHFFSSSRMSSTAKFRGLLSMEKVATCLHSSNLTDRNTTTTV